MNGTRWEKWKGPTTIWTAPGAGDPLRILHANTRTVYSERHVETLIARYGPEARTNLRVLCGPLGEWSTNRLLNVTVWEKEENRSHTW